MSEISLGIIVWLGVIMIILVSGIMAFTKDSDVGMAVFGFTVIWFIFIVGAFVDKLLLKLEDKGTENTIRRDYKCERRRENSEDLEDTVIALYEDGKSVREIAKSLDLDISEVTEILIDNDVI